ncbi:hydrogen peroxide-inducible genes activator [Thalassotalea euphylliae]|uniref:Hydrogen peroxide-inducible genes activator n=1 Tax=Thalassotalea euphylliae TaxID=1655234 RepID=A0A3E0U5E9_9GAMM|nr:hydrogen peroxide-inducible genes activator [Thalassotalea euphylliae]REL31405.1 hydrogen peroxide-inducible genes activator [Thalassotalea euphylliae]REL37131.1 hydrogen peroxide-inducible genes activator [Thalassotalea euphylliae]
MISLKQINYALAVGKTLHFKKAAEMCNVSQSALSSAINEMETQLGLKVFERNNKHVFITDIGQQVLAKAQQVKLELEELMQLSQMDKSPLSTPMTLGIIPTIGPYLLPKVLPEVRKNYPDFRLKIVEAQSHELVDRVRTGDLDAAILALPYAIDGLMSFEFWQEDFYMVCHHEECPANTKEISTQEMAMDKLMLLKEGHCLKDHALAACQHKSVEKDSTFDATSLHTIVQMVAGKLGTTLVPEMALQQLLHNESELRALHLNEPGPHRSIAFIIRPNYVKTNDIEVLMKLFRQQLKLLCTKPK